MYSIDAGRQPRRGSQSAPQIRRDVTCDCPICPIAESCASSRAPLEAELASHLPTPDVSQTAFGRDIYKVTPAESVRFRFLVELIVEN